MNRSVVLLAPLLLLSNVGCGSSGEDACTQGSKCTSGTSPEPFVPKARLTTVLTGDGAGRIVSSPPGIDCPGICVADFPFGSNVNLRSIPEPSSDFMGWLGPECSGRGTCMVVMDGPKFIDSLNKLIRIVLSSDADLLKGADSADSNAPFNIWAVNVDGTHPVPLTNARNAISFAPRMSPLGDRIVFLSDRNIDGTDAPNPNFTFNLWTVRVDGT